MNRTVFIYSFLLTLVSCNVQDQYDLFNPDLGGYLKIKENNILSDFDTVTGDITLKYWKTGTPVIIDSGGSALYGSNIYAYGSKKNPDYLILWVTENEYVSDIRIYILDSDTIRKMGNLPVRRVCDECDDVVYPIEKLKIYALGNEIVIDPIISFEYDIGNDTWKEYSPGQLYFLVEKDEGKLTSKRP